MDAVLVAETLYLQNQQNSFVFFFKPPEVSIFVIELDVDVDVERPKKGKKRPRQKKLRAEGPQIFGAPRRGCNARRERSRNRNRRETETVAKTVCPPERKSTLYSRVRNLNTLKS